MLHSVTPTLQQATADPRLCQRLLDTHEQVYFCFTDYAKAFDSMDQNNCSTFLKRWEYQTTWPASWEIRMQVRKQHLELDMKQQKRQFPQP